MKKKDFYYKLPSELIAQEPIENREFSRLLVLDRYDATIEHRNFFNIKDYLRKGDCLVLNNTRVLPARLYGIKQPTGARVEFLLLNNQGQDIWEVMVGPGKRANKGSFFEFSDKLLSAEVVDVLDNGNRLAKFSYKGDFYEILNKIGEMPLPHYISNELKDKERYQTVYSKNIGSAAAPTAGLHFSLKLLNEIERSGINIVYITLHVGIGTFRPVKAENIEEHKMHFENFSVSENAAEKINETKKNGNRIIAVGTTSCRTLEALSDNNGYISAGAGSTDIFIYPGYKFKCIDALITNFHLPESTLIMLVSAFCGTDNTMNAYKIAVREKYRFYSFGDAMLIK